MVMEAMDIAGTEGTVGMVGIAAVDTVAEATAAVVVAVGIDQTSQGTPLKRGRSKISWTICRIPVRPFDYVVKGGQPPGPKTLSG